MKLIFALGNPGSMYAGSRHNTGFMAINALADKLGVKWSTAAKFNAMIAEKMVDGEKVILAKPTTYYNESGQAARAILDYHKMPFKNMLIVHDDLTLPFGTVRVRGQGGDAGNNGMKSINEHVEGDYTRIKIGIANDMTPLMNDADFVLAYFRKPEQDALEKTIIPHVIELIDDFIAGAIELKTYNDLGKQK